jgi:hypothetical protein
VDALFGSDVTKDLDQKSYNLVLTMVGDAAQRRIDSLVRCLNDGRLHDNKKHYIIDCLKTIGSTKNLVAIEQCGGTGVAGAAVAAAWEIAARQRTIAEPAVEAPMPDVVFCDLPESFRNPYELCAEYVRIPAGSFQYSVTKKAEQVPDLYFAKHPVTNQRHRRFKGDEQPVWASLGSMRRPIASG